MHLRIAGIERRKRSCNYPGSRSFGDNYIVQRRCRCHNEFLAAPTEFKCRMEYCLMMIAASVEIYTKKTLVKQEWMDYLLEKRYGSSCNDFLFLNREK